MPKPWGRTTPGVLCWKNREEARVAGVEGGGEGREGTGQVVQGLVGHGEDLGDLTLRTVGAMESCGQKRDRP